jgi:hypothetical protein
MLRRINKLESENQVLKKKALFEAKEVSSKAKTRAFHTHTTSTNLVPEEIPEFQKTKRKYE